MEKKQAPSLGPYKILEHQRRDALGEVYHVKNEANEKLFLRIIDPKISQGEGFEQRFALLKTVLPELTCKNLIAIEGMHKLEHFHVIAKKLPESPYESLEKLLNDRRESLFQQDRLKDIFLSIAHGLLELENIQKSYFQKGIAFDCLQAKNIVIDSSKAFLDAYAESFLYFAEGPMASLLYQSADARFLSKEKIKSHLLLEQGLYPPDLRQGKPLKKEFALATYGALLYYCLCNQYPKGIYQEIENIHPELSPIWQEIVNKSLSRVYKSAKEIIDDLKKIPPKKNKPKGITPPKGMALISFDSGVELGAKDGPKNEHGRFRAKIKAFYLDIHPVTCKEFNRFLPSYQRSPISFNDQQPATRVSLQMAKAYCRWRSLVEGLPENTYRLPSEYEWEAAARGENGDLYPWGNDLQKEKLYCELEHGSKTLDVKALEPSRFGLYQMLGNVWEWTSSIYTSHPFAKEKFANQNLYTIKGGSCTSPAKLCRASLRKAFPAGYQSDYLSFRCARSLDN